MVTYYNDRSAVNNCHCDLGGGILNLHFLTDSLVKYATAQDRNDTSTYLKYQCLKYKYFYTLFLGNSLSFLVCIIVRNYILGIINFL